MSQYSKATVYKGKFQKQNGDVREMQFHKVSEMTETELAPYVAGARKAPRLDTGSELVFDVEAGGFRIFNYRTMDGELEVIG
jgi:hypothetical protein